MQNESLEQKARDILERMGIDCAQNFTAGDLVELANTIGNHKDAERYRKLRAIALEDGMLEYHVAISQFDHYGDGDHKNDFDACVDAMIRHPRIFE